MKTERLIVSIDGSESKRLILEPWGMEIVVAPDHLIELELTGPDAGAAEVEHAVDGSICLYAWAGATVVARQGGAIVYDTRALPTPSPPGTLSMREFITTVFGGPGKAGPRDP